VVITIDGPGGVGKSTVSRAVADELDLPYLDTGATYRAATLAVLIETTNINDEAAVLATVKRHEIDYDARGILLDGAVVAMDVRTPAVTQNVSAVSAHPSVRTEIVELQRRWVARHDGAAVVEGRDIGTVVFPDAPVKVFLTARQDVRAARRAGDVEAAGESIEQIAQALERRDVADASRAASPMRAASDAVVIDTSDLDVDGVVGEILLLVADATSDTEE
jgi:cytidylate kinase